MRTLAVAFVSLLVASGPSIACEWDAAAQTPPDPSIAAKKDPAAAVVASKTDKAAKSTPLAASKPRKDAPVAASVAPKPDYFNQRAAAR